MSVRQFWELMQRWRVPDQTALEVVDYAGKIGRDGRRPRLRFSTRQRRLTAYLPEIDASLSAVGGDSAWLHRKIAEAPFAGRSPLALMRAEGAAGAAAVLRTLQRSALRRSLRARTSQRP